MFVLAIHLSPSSSNKSTVGTNSARVQQTEQTNHEFIPSHVQATAERSIQHHPNTTTTEHIQRSESLLDWGTAREVFRKETAEGPVYACTCCRQLWFRRSVCRLDPVRRVCLPGTSITGLLSKDGFEYLCFTCSKYLSKGKDPPCSPSKMPDFPPLPPELQDLTDLENDLIAPRIPFMHIRPLPRGRQLKLFGGVVNVPTDTAQACPNNPSSDMGYRRHHWIET